MIEIEKKYRVSDELFRSIEDNILKDENRPEDITHIDDELEENTLFSSSFLEKGQVVRIRKARSYVMGARKSILTYKEPISNEDGLRKQVEIETEVNAFRLEAIFKHLGLTPSLVYEKKRSTWGWELSTVCLDELPFGKFIEIEGATEECIEKIEEALGLKDFIEPKSYPTLTKEFGETKEGVIEARF